MESKRRVRYGIYFSLLVIWGNISTDVSGQSLDCTNDYNATMFCYFDASDCTGYSVTVRSNEGYGEVNCTVKQGDNGQCSCHIYDMTFILGETHTATVWKGGNSTQSKIIDITASIKPTMPTITSVKESNGNFLIRWTTNYMKSFKDSLTAKVTYHKKGDTEMVSEFMKPTTVGGLNEFEILGRDLEPSTTYAVSVQSHTDLSDKYSDSSPEWEFTTSMSPSVLPLALIITLSIAAAIISGAIYVCTVHLKSKWWDKVAKSPNPKLLDMFPSPQEVLKPEPPMISKVNVEPLDPDDGKPWLKDSVRDTSSGSPQQSSGISTGSSCLSYAHTETDIIACVQDALGKAFANISPVSPLITNPLSYRDKDSTLLSSAYNPCHVPADDINSGSSCFDNKTYSILIPTCQNPMMTDGSEIQSEMLCDSSYGPSTGDTATCADQQAPACLPIHLQPGDLSLMPTDMSYQQCNADSGGFSYAEDSSLSSVSNGDPESGADDGRERFDEAASGVMKLHESSEVPAVSDENPCYGCMPAGSNSFPSVDNDYQAFQNLVEQPVILFSEGKSGPVVQNPDEPFTKMPQSFSSPVAPSFMNNAQGEECLSELQRPFLSLLPADQSMPLITGSGYQSV